ncbi:MAG: hypothetical protein IPH26_22935 [Sterolibacteriaceae bacterium]|uniref:Uncharacterized protein n=1 Tax=Candidatus Methylophosphatis roskildensis TaxID=2899263 RepID=A0A9D7E858_9PROT|nr:hypothetical protein [Candidatus Methylophosphatis roskildensis]
MTELPQAPVTLGRAAVKQPFEFCARAQPAESHESMLARHESARAQLTARGPTLICGPTRRWVCA